MHTNTLNQNRHHAVSTEHGEQRKVKFVVDGDVIQWKQSVIQVSFFFHENHFVLCPHELIFL